MKREDSLLSSPQLDHNEQQNALALSPKQLQSLYRKSKSFGIPFDVLEAVYLRGVAMGGDSGTGFNRVDSFIQGGKAAELDSDLNEGIGSFLKSILTSSVKGAARHAAPKLHKNINKVKKAANNKHIKKLRENVVVQGEPQSDNPAEPSSRFAGTEKLTDIYKNETPGQETRADVVRRVVRDQINKSKKDPT